MARELGRPLTVGEVKPAAAAALSEVFDLELDPLPADDGHGLWASRCTCALPRAEDGQAVTGRRSASRQAGTTSGLRVQTR